MVPLLRTVVLATIHSKDNVCMPSSRPTVVHDVPVPFQLGPGERMSYACGDLAGNAMFGITGSYLLYFYVNVCGLAAGQVAILMLAARVVDSVADPCIGYMIDRRRLFRGRVGPYMKWFSLPLGLALLLCFIRLPVGAGGRLAWAYGTYLLMGIVFSMVNVPYGVLPNVMTRNGRDRLSLAMFRMMGATGGTFFMGAVTLPLVHWLGGGNERIGYPAAMAVIGLLGGLVLMVPAFTCTERYVLQPAHNPLRVMLASLLRNRAWVVVTVVLSLFYINLTAFYGLSLYYATAVLGRPATFGGLLISVMGIGKVLGVTCSGWLVRRIGQRATVAVPYVLSALCLVVFVCAPNRPVLLGAVFGLACFFEGMTLPVFYAMIADAIDLGAVLTGVRAAGLAYSINSFMGKVAWAAGGALSAAMLGWGGYVSGLAVQSPQARAFICMGFVGVPIFIACVSAVLVWFYPSEDEVMAIRLRAHAGA